ARHDHRRAGGDGASRDGAPAPRAPPRPREPQPPLRRGPHGRVTGEDGAEGSRGDALGGQRGAATGRAKQNVAPPAALLAAHSRPSCDVMMERQIDSPSPRPSSFVVTQASNNPRN